MRKLLLVAALALTGPLLTAPAQAEGQIYAWCHSPGNGGVRNCGFETLQQCLDNRGGPGESCDPNTLYRDPPPAPAAAAQKDRPVPAEQKRATGR